MDEPTTGMDVITRKEVWSIIRREIANGCSILLTSESMEECEQLCTRIAIMKKGHLLTIGTPSHITQQ